MFKAVDRILNDVTMYRLMLYVLGAMSLVGVAFGFIGWISTSGTALLGSLACLLVVCFASNRLFARMLGAAENVESATITALILFLILFPAEKPSEYGFLVLAGVIAMASKYLVTAHRRHVFNPAAFGAVAMGLLGWGAGWWVGSAVMLPVVAVGGLMVLRKTKRGYLFAAFVLAAMASMALTGQWAPAEAFLSWPLVFFGTIMLTEPLTLPASKPWQIAEAAVVGLLFAVPYHLGPLYSSPELALLIGNLFACAAGMKRTYRLRLEQKNELAPGVFEFAFSTSTAPRFAPGQYFEWTLPHEHPDARGNRRTFTVASSPHEPLVRLGVRVPQKPSSFKRALSDMQVGDVLFGSNLGGEFTLPRDATKKLAFIAGGIGITPFRSMAQSFADRAETRDAVLLYACRSESDFVYRDVFVRAESYGLRLREIVGHISPDMVKADVPDYHDRVFYLSGPPSLVQSYRGMLADLGVKAADIRTDYFSGY